MTSPRERILDRVRAAVASRSRIDHPGPLVAGDAVAGAGGPAGSSAGAARVHSVVARFAEQLQANGGEVVQFASLDAARAWLDGFVLDFEGVATGNGVPAVFGPAAGVVPPESAALGISLAVGAAAETGTLLLDSGEGRRPQLLPPVHVVWIRAQDIDGTLGEALARLHADRRHALPAAVGLHSAPSKSADIGRVLVVGVHGPGRVIAAILDPVERTE